VVSNNGGYRTIKNSYRKWRLIKKKTGKKVTSISHLGSFCSCFGSGVRKVNGEEAEVVVEERERGEEDESERGGGQTRWEGGRRGG